MKKGKIAILIIAIILTVLAFILVCIFTESLFNFTAPKIQM